METLVLYLYGLWFWLTRKYRTARYHEAAEELNAARTYLMHDFAGRASTRDRGTLLPEQVEAIAILDRHSAFAARAAQRFDSLGECYRFVVEELTGAPAPPAPIPAPVRNALAKVYSMTQRNTLRPSRHAEVVEIVSAARGSVAEPADLRGAA